MKHSMRAFLWVFAVVTAANMSSASAEKTAVQYRLQAALSQDQTSLDVTVAVSPADGDDTPKNFMLNRHAEIKAITWGGKRTGYTFDINGPSANEFVEESRLLSVEPRQDHKAPLTISYRVPLNLVNALDHLPSETNQIELNGYSAWFPLRENFGTFRYTATFEFPEGLKLFGNGDMQRTDSSWTLTSSREGFDIVLFASEKLDTLSFMAGKSEISVTHLGANETVITELSTDIPAVLSSFEDWFGQLSGDARDYHFIITPRPRGTSYSRGNFAVMTDVKPEEYDQLFRIAGHEIGHFWWNKADSSDWHDWLNEGFSEYAAIAALGNKYGAPHADKIWQKEAGRFDTLPAIQGLDRGHSKAQAVLYYKAAYLLNQLKQKGDTSVFFNFLKSVHQLGVTKTEQLFAPVRQHYGAEVSNWFQGELAR